MMNSVKDFRGKIESPVEKGVLKIERYAQRLTQGYSAYGGSYLWAPDKRDFSRSESRRGPTLLVLRATRPSECTRHARDTES